MNDEPCLCGTTFTCLADVHLMPTGQAALYLGIGERSVRQAVTRGRLRAAGRDELGYVFDAADLDRYSATRRARTVALRHRSAVPSPASG